MKSYLITKVNYITKIAFKICLFFYVIVLFFGFTSIKVKAANFLDVVISEIAWMGTAASDDDEWIELYNNTNSEVDLSGWTLYAQDGTPKINLTGKIQAKSFYILERTDDTTIADILADQIYTGAMLNSGEILILKDKDGNIIDKVDAWYAGDSVKRATMERIDVLKEGNIKENWQTAQTYSAFKDAKGNFILGSPKSLTLLSNQTSNISQNSQESLTSDSQSQNSQTNSQNTTNTQNTQSATLTTPSNSMIELNIQVQNSQGNFQIADEATLLTEQKLKLKVLANLSLTEKEIKWNDGRGKIYNGYELETSFPFPGTYIISVQAQKDGQEAIKQFKVNVFTKGIIISEFLPNPEGKDKNEWIELYNQNPFSVDLGGYILKIGDKKFTFAPLTYIYPKSFLLVTLEKTGLILKNSGGSISLALPSEEIIDNVSYDKSPKENYAAARESFSANEFYWTSKPTPGYFNLINPTKSFNDFSNPHSLNVSQKNKNVIMIGQGSNVGYIAKKKDETISKVAIVQDLKNVGEIKSVGNERSDEVKLAADIGDVLNDKKIIKNNVFTPFNFIIFEILVFAIFASFGAYFYFYKNIKKS